MKAEEFFALIQGQYRNFAELRAAANAKAVEHLEHFPLPFDMEAYLNWATKRGWITRTKEWIVVRVPANAQPMATSAD